MEWRLNVRVLGDGEVNASTVRAVKTRGKRVDFMMDRRCKRCFYTVSR